MTEHVKAAYSLCPIHVAMLSGNINLVMAMMANDESALECRYSRHMPLWRLALRAENVEPTERRTIATHLLIERKRYLTLLERSIT